MFCLSKNLKSAIYILNHFCFKMDGIVISAFLKDKTLFIAISRFEQMTITAVDDYHHVADNNAVLSRLN